MALTKVTYAMIQGAASNVVDFGADPTGTDDSSAAFEAAYADCVANTGTMWIPAGTYKVTASFGTSSEKPIVICGSGEQTVITAVNAGEYAFTFDNQFITVENIYFDGALKTKNGVTTASTTANNIKFVNVHFYQHNIGVYKKYGNYGFQWDRCKIWGNNYGIYAESVTGSMHAGLDKFKNGYIEQNAICGYYIDDTEGGTGGTVIEDTVIESNAFGIYIYNYGGATAGNSTFTVNRCWFEANGTPSSVTVAHFKQSTTDTQTSHDFFMRNAKNVKLNASGYLPTRVKLYSTNLTTFDQELNVLVKDTHSSIVSYGGFGTDGGLVSNYLSLAPNILTPNATSIAITKVPHRNAIVFRSNADTGPVNLIADDLTQAANVANSSSAVLKYNDGLLTGRCTDITLAANQMNVHTNNSFSTGSGWSLFTIALKNSGGLLGVQIVGSQNVVYGEIPANTDWATYAFIKNNANSSTGNYVYFYEKAGGATTIRVADMQFLNFSTLEDLMAYVQSGLYTSNGYPKIAYGSAAPTTGTWKVGALVYNTVPTSGGYVGWVCTGAGTPGTWKTFGVIS